MKLLNKMVCPSLTNSEGIGYERIAARAIVTKGSKILLMYTKYYNDYSFPGGGVDSHEDLHQGLMRELHEETGAMDIRIISEFGYIDETRPYYKPEYDYMHMLSYFYFCSIGDDLGEAKLENYEISNGMSAVWIDIHEAIAHNRQVIANNEKSMGLSIQRETFVLEEVAKIINQITIDQKVQYIS